MRLRYTHVASPFKTPASGVSIVKGVGPVAVPEKGGGWSCPVAGPSAVLLSGFGRVWWTQVAVIIHETLVHDRITADNGLAHN